MLQHNAQKQGEILRSLHRQRTAIERNCRKCSLKSWSVGKVQDVPCEMTFQNGDPTLHTQ